MRLCWNERVLCSTHRMPRPRACFDVEWWVFFLLLFFFFQDQTRGGSSTRARSPRAAAIAAASFSGQTMEAVRSGCLLACEFGVSHYSRQNFVRRCVRNSRGLQLHIILEHRWSKVGARLGLGLDVEQWRCLDGHLLQVQPGRALCQLLPGRQRWRRIQYVCAFLTCSRALVWLFAHMIPTR